MIYCRYNHKTPWAPSEGNLKRKNRFLNPPRLPFKIAPRYNFCMHFLQINLLVVFACFPNQIGNNRDDGGGSHRWFYKWNQHCHWFYNLKIIQRSQKVSFNIINLSRNFNHCKLSCKVQKLTRCHMKIFLKVSKSKYFVPGPVKSFSKFFFL